METIARSLINMLIQLAEVDKHFAKAERELLMRIADQRQISHEVVLELIRKPEPITHPEDMPTDQRYEYLVSSIEMIIADKYVFESELQFSRKIASRLGFDPQAVDHLVSRHAQLTGEDLKRYVLENFLIKDFGH